MKRVIYSYLVVLPLLVGTQARAAECNDKPQARCAAAAGCQWDSSSKSCVEKEVGHSDTGTQFDEGAGAEAAPTDADAKTDDSDLNEF